VPSGRATFSSLRLIEMSIDVQSLIGGHVGHRTSCCALSKVKQRSSRETCVGRVADASKCVQRDVEMRLGTGFW
jgi:hypothetical protein